MRTDMLFSDLKGVDIKYAPHSGSAPVLITHNRLIEHVEQTNGYFTLITHVSVFIDTTALSIAI